MVTQSVALTGAGTSSAGSSFKLFYDETCSDLTPYHDGGAYFAKAKDRMDRTFNLIKGEVAGSRMLDIGASPFYLLYRAKALGAVRCAGIYFAYDTHPMKGIDRIFSKDGPIELHHANVETDDLPFADDSIDVLTACEILEHCEYFPERLASEIRRVLRPGGLLCITVPNVCSIANIVKLSTQKNIYMKYRSDPTGRHKHEYTLSQLRAFIGYLQMDVVRAGFMPSPTSDKYWLRPIYRAIAKTPVLRSYSPVTFIVARQRDPKPKEGLGAPPDALYENALSIED